MLPLYEMMAQNGQAVELMARQFNLSQQQAALAMEALAPAFSQGLKRNTSDPYGVSNFLQALASGQHAKYYENAASAFSPAGMQDGNGMQGGNGTQRPNWNQPQDQQGESQGNSGLIMPVVNF